MPAKILWLGDAGCTTGFGRVSHAIGDRLVRDYGHDIHALAVNYDGDAGKWSTGLRLYMPNQKVTADIYGQSRFVEMLSEVMPDLVIMLNDPYVVLKFLFRNRWDPDCVLARARPILAYMPVDGYEFPTNWTRLPELVGNLEPLENNDERQPRLVPVVMSEHGWTLFPGAPLIPHGIDSDLFHPPTPQAPILMSNGTLVTSRTDAKRALGMDPDTFLVLRVDRNSHRKNFAETWKAVNPLVRKYSNMRVWFHCRAEGDTVELHQVLSRDPATADRYHFPGNFSTKVGWSNGDLATIYAAADVFVSTSWGEGFGLTLGEAAASGVPVIAQNVSSIPEVVGPGAVLLEPERPITVDSGEDQWLPNIAAFTDAIDRLYHNRRTRRELGEAGRAHVTSRFNWDDVAGRFDELITKTLQETPAPSSGEKDAEPAHR